MKSNIKVVSVLDDDYKIVLNVGEFDGVSFGQRFLIYSLSDHEIIDPDTGDSLGFLEIVKGTGKVIHIQDKMCTIESNKYEDSLPQKITRRSKSLFEISPPIIEETKIERNHLPFESPSIGDLAKLI